MISRKKRERYKYIAEQIAKNNNLELNTHSWDDVWNMLDKFPESTKSLLKGSSKVHSDAIVNYRYSLQS